MEPFQGKIWPVLLFAEQQSQCISNIKELIFSISHSQCQLSIVQSLPETSDLFFRHPFDLILIHTPSNEVDLIEQIVSLKRLYVPFTRVIVLYDGDHAGLNIDELLAIGVTDVINCMNSEWVSATLSKHYAIFINNFFPTVNANSPFVNLDKILYNFPYGFVRIILKPKPHIGFINPAARQIFSNVPENHDWESYLVKTLINPEKLQQIHQNHDSTHSYATVRYKFTSSVKANYWIEATYLPGAQHNNDSAFVDVLLRDVTREEIDKSLQKAVYDIAKITSSNFSLNRILTIVHKIVAELIEISNFYIALYDLEKDIVTFPYYSDVVDSSPPKPRIHGHGLTEYVIRTGKTLLCKPQCFDELLLSDEIEQIGTKPQAWLGVPLRFHGKVLGAIVVQHYTNPEAFGEYEQQILEYFSEQVARTIDFKHKTDTVKLLSVAVEQSPVSIVITNLKSEIVFVNPTFTSVTGYEKNEVIGKNPRFLQSGQTSKETYIELWDTITNGKTWTGEFINKRKNGEIFYEESIIVPIIDEFGRNTHYLSVKLDITEKKKLTDELIVAKEKAEESDRLKTSFLQNISHEIRTPMNAIVGFAEILETDHDDEEKISYYTGVIKQRSYDLLDIVNELLDISRIESGQFKAELKPFELKDLFNDLLQIFEGYKSRMEKQDVEIKLLSLPGNLSSVINSDESKLRQVFINLINNALKFTHKGYVEFGFHELTNGDIVFRVTDTGIGIPAEIQDKIFERFQKATPQGVIYDGLGLGLTIVRSLINLLNGKIWLESEVGKGTSFYFSIPYEPHEAIARAEHVEPNPESIKNFKLLVIEDDTYNIAYFNELFSSLAVDYHVEITGTNAIEHFRNNQNYDMVLLDIKLPDMTGYEVVEEFKRINPDVPIIAQTAYAAESDREKALKAGCIDYISKPIFRDKLISMLHKHLVKKV